MQSMMSPFTNPDGSRPGSISIMSMGALSAQGTPAFPPPPQSSRDRSGSRHRQDGQRSLFNLSALTSRNKNERSAAPNAMDALRQNTNEVLAGSWGTPGMPTAQLLSQRYYYQPSLLTPSLIVCQATSRHCIQSFIPLDSTRRRF